MSGNIPSTRQKSSESWQIRDSVFSLAPSTDARTGAAPLKDPKTHRREANSYRREADSFRPFEYPTTRVRQMLAHSLPSTLRIASRDSFENLDVLGLHGTKAFDRMRERKVA